MVRVTQASKTRNDPLGVFSPYGSPGGVLERAPGEYRVLSRPLSAGAPAPAHRAAPRMPRAHYIGTHLQNKSGLPPTHMHALEERAMRRAVEMDAKARSMDRRLEEMEAEVSASRIAIARREEAIATLKAKLNVANHALEVAQTRIWRPASSSSSPDLHAAGPVPRIDGVLPNEWICSAWLEQHLGREGEFGRLLAESLLAPLGDWSAHDAHAQRLFLMRLGQTRPGGEAAIQRALIDGGLLDKISARLLPLLRSLAPEEPRIFAVDADAS